jgi:uncharacterized protein
MKKQILFIQGAGEGAYKADKLLADSLQRTLGTDYEIIYPEMPDEENTPYEQWKNKIINELAVLENPILVGHSVGASIIAKFLSEVNLEKQIHGIFFIANPFWGGDGWLYEGYEELELPHSFSTKLPKNTSIFLYHCRDDEVVPFAHLALYVQILPDATVRKIDQGGHQLSNDLSVVAKDIKNLKLVQ